MAPKPCVYCGEIADTIDHVVPRHLLERAGEIGLDLSEIFRFRDWVLPACRECNGFIGSRVFKTLVERRACAHATIRRKYAAYLRIPDWDEEELAEMGRIAQHDIRFGLAVRDRTRSRLAWTGTRDVDLLPVYGLIRRVYAAPSGADSEKTSNEA